MDKIAVLGGGSLGMLLAGKLTASNCDCELWTRTRSQASLLNSSGLKLEEESEERLIKIKAVPFEEAYAGGYDFVLLAVKQTTLVPEFLSKLEVAIPIGGTLVLFQNGIGHLELLRHVLPGRKLITAVTTEGALRIDATTVRHTGHGETRISDRQPDFSATSADRNNHTFTAELLYLERLLKQAGFSVFLSKHLEGAILRKLLINAVINPLTAILRIRNGELTETTARLKLMRALFQETYEVVKGYGLGEENELWDVVLQVCSATRNNESSMLQDVSAHKETEIEFINGAICRLANQQGREAPWNEAVTALVKAATK